MPMNHVELLNAIIDDGIHEIEANYLRPDQQSKREGGIAGFSICRGKSDAELLQIREDAHQLSQKKLQERDDSDNKGYWYHRCFELQVEWVLNVLSAARAGQGLAPLTAYTARGAHKAMDILGAKT